MSSDQIATEAPGQQPAQQQPAQALGGEHSEGPGGYELDEDGQRIPHGMGQSKSSRRRRRKRKNKGADGVTSPTDSPSGESSADSASQMVSSMQASGDPQTSQPSIGSSGNSASAQGPRQNSGQGRNFQAREQSNNGQQNGVNAPGGTKRWKKKFRDRDRPRTPESAGGQQNAGGGGGFSQSNGSGSGQSTSGGFRGVDTHQPGNGGSFKRKGGFGGGGGGGGRQQRPARGFVGPMDHSYRAVNGNFPETPPSTIEPHGSHGGGGGRQRTYQGDSQPIDYSQGRAIPIAEGAPTKIYFFIEDLFFTAKIQETARKLGVKIAFIKNDKESIAALTSGEDADRPGLIVFDLNNASAKPMTLIPKLKAKLKKSTSIIGFLSHLQGDLKAKAVEAGCDTVMPRAAFSQNLPNLLRRYGIEDVEEPNYNQ